MSTPLSESGWRGPPLLTPERPSIPGELNKAQRSQHSAIDGQAPGSSRQSRYRPPSIVHNLSVVYIRRVVNIRKVVYNTCMGKFDPAPTLAAGLLRLARDKAAMTQADLASNAGISQQAVSAYETGRKEPTLPTLQRLLAAAGLEMRIRLEPIDDHDATLKALMKTLPPARQAELADQSRSRVEAARLRRVRGN